MSGGATGKFRSSSSANPPVGKVGANSFFAGVVCISFDDSGDPRTLKVQFPGINQRQNIPPVTIPFRRTLMGSMQFHRKQVFRRRDSDGSLQKGDFVAGRVNLVKSRLIRKH